MVPGLGLITCLISFTELIIFALPLRSYLLEDKFRAQCLATGSTRFPECWLAEGRSWNKYCVQPYVGTWSKVLLCWISSSFPRTFPVHFPVAHQAISGLCIIILLSDHCSFYECTMNRHKKWCHMPLFRISLSRTTSRVTFKFGADHVSDPRA